MPSPSSNRGSAARAWPFLLAALVFAGLGLATLWLSREVVVPVQGGYVVLDRWRGLTTVCHVSAGQAFAGEREFQIYGHVCRDAAPETSIAPRLLTP
jgi:hypothetical protein